MVATRQDAVDPHARTAAGDAFSRFAFLVIRLSNLLGGAGDALARPAGQTSARWQVLAGAEAGTLTVADIARMLGLARQSVQRVADTLEADGFVTSADNPRHRRAKLLRLTDRGREALTAIQAAQAVWANGLGKTLGERDLRRASEVLEAAVGALSAVPLRRRRASDT
jgi:DNA-binding MarR family transcriptional regulator